MNEDRKFGIFKYKLTTLVIAVCMLISYLMAMMHAIDIREHNPNLSGNINTIRSIVGWLLALVSTVALIGGVFAINLIETRGAHDNTD